VPAAALEAGQQAGRPVAVERKELARDDEVVAGIRAGLLDRAVQPGLPNHEVRAEREHRGGHSSDQDERDSQPPPEAARADIALGHTTLLLGHCQLVAGAPDRTDEARVRRVVLDLRAEPLHRHIHEPGVAEVRVPPDPVQQQVAG
jgi:hypothetical protein